MLLSSLEASVTVSDLSYIGASERTVYEFSQIIGYCKDIFVRKMKDYGTAWRILRISSLTDQLFIKAKRIRTLQSSDQQAVKDDPRLEFVGIVNYAIMALVQLRLGAAEDRKSAALRHEVALSAYEEEVEKIRQLLAAKNHDYGDAWRHMRITSLTDQLLMRLLRLKQIEEQESKFSGSETPESIYQDIVNYAVFSLILLKFSPT